MKTRILFVIFILFAFVVMTPSCKQSSDIEGLVDKATAAKEAASAITTENASKAAEKLLKEIESDSK